MILLQILGFACLAHLIVDMITHLDIKWLPEKPFKCDMCMGYWISIIPFMIQFGLVGILYAAISGVTANLIYKYI
jgi:hypothetical protein